MSKGVRVVAALEMLGGVASLVFFTPVVLRTIPQVRAGVASTRDVVLFFGVSAFIAALAVFFIAAGWRLWRGGPGAFRWSLWAQGISIPKLQLGGLTFFFFPIAHLTPYFGLEFEKGPSMGFNLSLGPTFNIAVEYWVGFGLPFLLGVNLVALGLFMYVLDLSRRAGKPAPSIASPEAFDRRTLAEIEARAKEIRSQAMRGERDEEKPPE